MPESAHAGRRAPLALVVEDEVYIAFYLGGLLQQLGFEVIGPTLTVEDALHRLETGETPDVACLDYRLGVEPVTPVAEALRRKGVPFVMVSAYDQSIVRADKSVRDVVWLGKPVDEVRLEETLRELVPALCAPT